MKISFSTLACPDWTVVQAIDIAQRSAYDGIELRFVEGEDSLWKLPDFRGAGLSKTKQRILDAGLHVSCVDTSCRFDSPNSQERQRWIEEGERMAALAANLEAPGIRVFGDRIQNGESREQTQAWITECLAELGERLAPTEIQVWLETHGDFSSSDDVQAVLGGVENVGVIWDPASAFVECGQGPTESAQGIQAAIRHVHIKDLKREADGRWSPALTGEGEFPLAEMKSLLKTMNYKGFISFEWEKKWHPQIPPAEIALPHFANWFRAQWNMLEKQTPSAQTGVEA